MKVKTKDKNYRVDIDDRCVVSLRRLNDGPRIFLSAWIIYAVVSIVLGITVNTGFLGVCAALSALFAYIIAMVVFTEGAETFSEFILLHGRASEAAKMFAKITDGPYAKLAKESLHSVCQEYANDDLKNFSEWYEVATRLKERSEAVETELAPPSRVHAIRDFLDGLDEVECNLEWASSEARELASIAEYHGARLQSPPSKRKVSA